MNTDERWRLESSDQNGFFLQKPNSMPDTRQLKIGDRVRFIAMPDEWSKPNFTLPREDRAFMKAMIKRRFPSRIYQIDEHGIPWIIVRLKHGNRYHLHMWAISESTGWRRVKKRR